MRRDVDYAGKLAFGDVANAHDVAKTPDAVRNALDITYNARCEILDKVMLPCIAEPRKEVSPFAPKMLTVHIDPASGITQSKSALVRFNDPDVAGHPILDQNPVMRAYWGIPA